MNILFNGTAIPEPAGLSSEWVTVSGTLLRQVTLRYEYATAAQASAILGVGSGTAPFNLSYLSPAANANVTFLVKCYSAEAAVLREASGAVAYAPIILTLRESILP